MKKLFVKVLSALLVLCLSLALAPVALMEETIEAQEEAVENAVIEVTEEQVIETTEGETEPSEETAETDVEAEIEAVDETVEEDQFVNLSDVNVFEAQNSEEEVELDTGEAPEETDESSSRLMEGGWYVYITKTNFPDDNFREYVKREFDLDHNNVLSNDERTAVTVIKLSEYNDDGSLIINVPVRSLEVGLQDFTELTDLQCEGCGLTSLNVSKNTKLEWLDCSNNLLSSLDVSKNTNLWSLSCEGNNLVSLDVSKNTNLLSLFCQGNQLVSLDVSNSTGLQSLSCSENLLTSLNVSKNTKLEWLNCSNNQLTSLDVSNNTALKELECSSNMLTALNVSNNKNLDSLYCERNSIKELDISDLVKIVPFVTSQYKRDEYENAVYYAQLEEFGEWGNYYSGSQLGCDKTTKLITTKPVQVTPSAAPAIPTISAIKRSSKTTITAAPGTVYILDLGGATGKKFKSSKRKVATVDSTGLVTVKAAGKTRITFKVGKKKRTVTLKVIDPTVPTYIALNMAGTVPVKVGETATLVPSMSAGANSGIKWKSSNKRVATVDQNGNVTFKKKGRATITATTTRGRKKARVKFKVSK